MDKGTITPTMLLVFVLLAVPSRAETNPDSSFGEINAGPAITVTGLDVGYETLELRYEIMNGSETDAWILVGWEGLGANSEVFMTEDDQTLMIRRRRALPTQFGFSPPPFYGRYARLRPRENRTGAVFSTIPVRPRSHFERIRRKERGLEHATHLAIEFGYYSGNLPERIFETLRPPENVFPEDLSKYPIYQDGFSALSELLLSREEEVLIPNMFREFEGERVLRTVVDDVHIPYKEKRPDLAELEVPDLTSCKRVELQYQPSMGKFFFPYASQQSLMSDQEVDYLKSNKRFALENSHEIAALAADVRKAGPIVISVPTATYVDLLCHYDDRPTISLRIYGDGSIRFEEVPLACEFSLASLRMLTPLVQNIYLRMQCAANLKNQWHRLRFFNHHEAMRQNDPSIKNEPLYPRSTDWCGAMLRPWPATGGIDNRRWTDGPYTCPSAPGGRSHYAMNSNCKADSPADMVLLFETKAGWNQHGGPEVFTSDNHDPKGGLVLLNDGTVKFIRTKEELQQLRWK